MNTLPFNLLDYLSDIRAVFIDDCVYGILAEVLRFSLQDMFDTPLNILLRDDPKVIEPQTGFQSVPNLFWVVCSQDEAVSRLIFLDRYLQCSLGLGSQRVGLIHEDHSESVVNGCQKLPKVTNLLSGRWVVTTKHNLVILPRYRI